MAYLEGIVLLRRSRGMVCCFASRCQGLLLFVSLNFISVLVITSKCLDYVDAFTCSLQAEAKDVVRAVTHIDNILGAPEKDEDQAG